MKFTATIKKNPHYTPDVEVKDFEKWEDVITFLRNGLDNFTICVEIYKWSSDSRCLGHVSVTMANIWRILWDGTESVLRDKSFK